MAPIHYDCEKGHKKVVIALLDGKAEVDSSTHRLGFTPLCIASRDRNDQKLIRSLLDRKADVNGRDHRSFSPLIYVAMRGQDKSTTVLLAARGDVNQVLDDGRAPLMYAVTKSNHSMVQILLAVGAAFDKKDKDGNACLDLVHYIKDLRMHGEIKAELENFVTRREDSKKDIRTVLQAAIRAKTRASSSHRTWCSLVL